MKKIFALIYLVLSSLAYSKVDYVRVMFNRNGATDATIGWHQVSGENTILYIDTIDFKAEDFLQVQSKIIPARENNFKTFNNKFIHLSQLKPNTAYYFVLVDNEGFSERFWFKTTPNDNSKIALIAGGDSRTRRNVRQNANKMVGKLYPHAVIFAGDYTDIDTPEKWKFWFEDWKLTYQDFDNRIIPLINVRGNHEQTNKDLTEFFDCPNKRNYYNVKLGGDLLNVLCLNTEWIFGFGQERFLKQCLEENSAMFWQLPVYHRACRPHVCWKLKMKGPKNIYRHWVEWFEQFGVKLVIECDSHITKTTYPIVQSKEDLAEEGFIRDDENGIIYAGEGCWGAPLRQVDCARSWTMEHGSINSFKWIFVDREKIELKTIDYMNVEEVPALAEGSRFKTPVNLKVWKSEANPSGTITILRNLAQKK